MIAALVVVMSFVSPYFLSAANFQAMDRGHGSDGDHRVGMTFLLVSGSFDLSVGSVMALSSTVVALLLLSGLPIPLAILGACAVGLAIGAVNGPDRHRAEGQPADRYVGHDADGARCGPCLYRGVLAVQPAGRLRVFGKAQILGLPLMAWIMLAIVLLGDLGLRRTRFLRQVYFIGGQRARGGPVGHSRGAGAGGCFMLSGLLAAFAGILLASRLMSGTPTAGMRWNCRRWPPPSSGGASCGAARGRCWGHSWASSSSR